MRSRFVSEKVLYPSKTKNPRRSVIIRIVVFAHGGTAIGRVLSLNGEIGTISYASNKGSIIGPPELKAYAVEPVGVDTITPSAAISSILSP